MYDTVTPGWTTFPMNKRRNAIQLRRSPLVLASLAFLAANLLHGFDHLRTGTERLATEVSVGGFLITIAALAMVYLALRGFPRAPLIAILIVERCPHRIGALGSSLERFERLLLGPQTGCFLLGRRGCRSDSGAKPLSGGAEHDSPSSCGAG